MKYLRQALESELPDERREAVERIARTRYLRRQIVLDALGTIAGTDRSPAVRCSALAALRRSGDPAIAVTLVAILDRAPAGGERPIVFPANADVRLEAMRAAIVLAEQDVVPDEQGSNLREVAVRLMAQDRSRDIRQASARFLGYCRHRTVLEPLIDTLEQRDFGVVYESERSLMRLTGQCFNHDIVGWRRWLEQADDPFAEAGKLDPSLDAPPSGWWKRSIDKTRRSFASFRPDKDDA